MFGMDAATANAVSYVVIAAVVIVFMICMTVIIVKRGWPTGTDLSGLINREPMWSSETTTTTTTSKPDMQGGDVSTTPGEPS